MRQIVLSPASAAMITAEVHASIATPDSEGAQSAALLRRSDAASLPRPNPVHCSVIAEWPPMERAIDNSVKVPPRTAGSVLRSRAFISFNEVGLRQNRLNCTGDRPGPLQTRAVICRTAT